MDRPLIIKRSVALLLIILSFAVWQIKPDLIELIVRQKPILFGRYPQGQFGALLVLTLLLWSLAGVLMLRQPLRRSLAGWALTVVMMIGLIAAVTYASHWLSKPRYVETTVSDQAVAKTSAKKHQELQLQGILRHRPPNQNYQFSWTDKPSRARSYPEAPSGYGTLDIALSSDANGYRNPTAKPPFNTVVVGDSFAAGSHVSDHQSWSELLQGESPLSIYNLGVSGSGPSTYLNNFAYYGLDKGARLAFFMIYEGNDFKPEVAAKINTDGAEQGFDFGRHFKTAFKSSPVTAGLRRLSENVFEKIGAENPVLGYQEKVGWMPVRITHEKETDFYSFKPKRLLYLASTKDQFRQSAAWQDTAGILQRFVELAVENNMAPIFLYAPSKPHVVMPLIRTELDAQQLHNFAAYKARKLPPPKQFKREFFDNIDSQESVFFDHCQFKGWKCLSLTAALQKATAHAQQTYYTYDQHWTPEGNRVVATLVQRYLEDSGLTH